MISLLFGFQDIIKSTAESHPDYNQLKEAMQKMVCIKPTVQYIFTVHLYSSFSSTHVVCVLFGFMYCQVNICLNKYTITYTRNRN